jgi:hypothetical protein
MLQGIVIMYGEFERNMDDAVLVYILIYYFPFIRLERLNKITKTSVWITGSCLRD